MPRDICQHASQRLLHTANSAPAVFAAPIAMAAENQPAATAIAVSPLPDFFQGHSAAWFIQIEATFLSARPRLTSAQKYALTITKLPQALLVSLIDTLTAITLAAGEDDADPYKQLKDAILQTTTKPKWSCYFDLHSLPPQGDIRPSQLMSILRNLMPAGVKTNNDLFYSFFMYRMPPSIREALALTEFTSADQLAAAADRIWDMRQHAPPAVAAAATQPRAASPHRADRRRADGRRDNRRRSPSSRRGPTQTPHNSQANDNGICHFHNKFQHNAYKCTPPCKWQGNGTASR